MKQCLKNVQSLNYEWEAVQSVFFLFTYTLESQRGYKNQLVSQQVKVLLESSNEFIVLLWLKSSVTSGIWRPQISRAKENAHLRAALPGSALKHDC